jgi:hypothetical protein
VWFHLLQKIKNRLTKTESRVIVAWSKEEEELVIYRSIDTVSAIQEANVPETFA